MKINSITEFLHSGNSQLRIYDMGRRITPIDTDSFLAIENATAPYPYPLQQAAWLALLHWQQESPDSHSIWFLRLPLDEDGLLDQASRDQFLFMLLESLGSEQKPQDAEVHNPFAFTPKQERMAMFHAKTLRTLGQPASSFYSHAEDYFSGKLGFDQWAFLGIQGIADLVARLDQANNSRLLASAIAELPERPLEAVCQCLESETPDADVASALIKRTEAELQSTECNPLLIAALLRACSGIVEQPATLDLLENILASNSGTQPEILASLSARCWNALRNDALRKHFIENLANNDGGQEIFNHICIDCLRLPGIGELVQQELRNPERSEQLSQAIGGLFNSLGEDTTP